MLTIFINYYLKLFFIMTPFFVLSSFLAMTTGMKAERRQKIALKVALAVLVSSFALFFFGKYIFALFGITLDAFRIGAGSVLFLSALSMINGRESVDAEYSHNDIAVVPLAIPITVGPGVIGVLMVMGAEVQS
ncbi:MAG: MarC family protein, partial [Burkholderiales bacterium]